MRALAASLPVLRRECTFDSLGRRRAREGAVRFVIDGPFGSPKLGCGFRGEVARESAMISPSIPIWSRSAFQDDFARHSGMMSPE